VARLGLSAPCFLDNPDLFTEVHRLWCNDYNRAFMYRVDPFKVDEKGEEKRRKRRKRAFPNPSPF